MRTPLLFAVAVGLSGCVEVEDRSTNWNFLHAAIIEPSCATIGCHSEATRAAGPTFQEVDLSAPGVAYLAITGVECGSGDDPALLTERGTQPDYPLMLLLEGAPYPDRDEFPGAEVELTQMPPDVPLPPADRALMRQWLEAGAPCE